MRILLEEVKDSAGGYEFESIVNIAGMSPQRSSGQSNFDPQVFPPDNMKKAIPFAEVANLQYAVLDRLGQLKSQDALTRAGARIIASDLRSFPSIASAARMAMRVGSLESKVKLGLEFFAKFQNSVCDQLAELQDEPAHWVWSFQRCPYCWERSSREPMFFVVVGMLRHIMEWVSEGRQYDVAERYCKANNAESCNFQIVKPLAD